MNQGIAFARTLRALDADDFRVSKFGLLVAAVLLAGWTWWMFAARVPQYETTTNVQIEAGRASAIFSAAAATRMHAGQPASIRQNGSAFPARVQNIAGSRVLLVFTNHQPPPTISTPVTAEVEVSTSSPAAIALHTVGGGERAANR